MTDSANLTRVALLHYGPGHHRKVLKLVNDIAGETIMLSPDTGREGLGSAVRNCDLILIEAPYHLSPKQRQAIRWIRTGSLAPVVVLTGDKHTDDMVDTIAAGADAVISLQTASDAILAHCRALMRRWSSHSCPSFRAA